MRETRTEQAALLRQPHADDTRDPFATDPNREVRQYGRLALRRATTADRVTDYVVIADLCARSTLADDGRLLIFYAGKTLLAFRRAIETADNEVERMWAALIADEFTVWLAQVARQLPTRRNIAVALWAVGDHDGGLPGIPGGVRPSPVAESLLQALITLYMRGGRPGDPTFIPTPTDLTTPGDFTPSADLTPPGDLRSADDLTSPGDVTDPDMIMSDLFATDDRMLSSPVPFGDLDDDSLVPADPHPSRTPSADDYPTVETPVAPLTADVDAFLSGEFPVLKDRAGLLTSAFNTPLTAATPVDSPAADNLALTSMEIDLSASLNTDIRPVRRLFRIEDDDNADDDVANIDADDGAASEAHKDAVPPAARPRRAKSPTRTQDAPAAGERGEFAPGQVLDGRFEIADVKRGGMGVVYLCYDRTLREPIALKTFQTRLLDNPRAMARFEQEALTWIRLERHRHIVEARLVESVSGRPHILLEHISGPEGLEADLRSWIERKRITVALALEFALGIALGMHHAVQRVPGLVHRDLKPANILVTHDGIAKVTDFGLVRSFETDDDLLTPFSTFSEDASVHRLTRAGAVIGTAPYMSPEQCRSEAVDQRSDIYAFGCVLYEMLAGRHIFAVSKFEAWLHAHQHVQPAFDAALMHSLPPGLTALALTCLAKQPAARPASWAVIVETLAALYREVRGEAPVMEISGRALEARELMDKGYSLTELRRYDEAVEAYDRAIGLKPDYAWAWARKARTLRLTNRLAESMVCYDEALRLQPRYGWAWRGKGIIHDRRGEYEEALLCYVTAARYDPDEVWNWFNQADALLKLNRPDEALACLKQALDRDPTHPNSWAHIGQIYRGMGRYEEAVGAYRRAIEIDPRYAWAYNGCGLALKMLKRLEEALAAFRNAARYDPGEFWHWYNLTEVLIDLRRGDEAIQPASELTRISPTNAIAWAKYGQVLRYARLLEDAMHAYQHAVEIDPAYGWAWNGLGIVYERLGRFEEALEAYRRTAEGSRSGEISQAWLWYNQGNLLTVLGRYDEALPALHKALAADPTHTHSWARMGNVYRLLRRLDDAADALEKALALDPRYVWAWSELGIVREHQERLPDALKAYRQAAELAPHDPTYLYSQSDVLLALGQAATALDLIEYALKQDRASARTWAKHGQVLRRMNRLDDALRSYSRAIEIDPSYAWAWNGRGQTLLALSQPAEAALSFRRAAEIDPADVWYSYSLGDALEQAEQFAAAASVLETTIHLHPRHAESWAKLAQTYRRLNRPAEALPAYDHALALQPDYAWAWFGRGKALETLRRTEEALASYERALTLDARAIWTYTAFIDLLLKTDRKADAARFSEQAVLHLPDNAQAWARRGQVQRRLSDHAGAAVSYGRAVEIDPTYAWAWNGLGLALMQRQQFDTAYDAFNTATVLHPGDLWFWHNVGDALLHLDLPDRAIEKFDRALEIDPHHEPTLRKRVIARAMLQTDHLNDTGDDRNG